MHDTFHKASVVRNDLIGDDVRHLVVSMSSPLSFLPGQFFILRLRDEKGDFVERSYSVANASQGKSLEFVIRIVEQGRMSRLIDQLEENQIFDIKGPFGRFGFGSLPKNFDRLVLIGAGVGISPLHSMLQSSFMKNENYPIQLFYGFRHISDFLFREEIEKFSLEDRFELFTANSSGESVRTGGNIGHISDFLVGNIVDPTEGTHCFICGPPQMVKTCREKLFELGFDRAHVHVEAW